MIWRVIAVLSALWCVLVVAPAVVAAHLLAEATQTSQKGWALGVWLVGYIAQFLVFLQISRRCTRPVLLGWLIASTVPWLADWAAPFTGWGVAVSGAVVGAYGVWLTAAVYRVDRLREAGVLAWAEVLDVIRPALNAVVTKDTARRSVRVRVQPPAGASPYEARMTGTFAVGEVPEPGDRLAVLVDPADPDHIEPVPDEQIVRGAPVPEDLGAQAADMLRRLVIMRDRGDITDAEFSAAKKQLLES
ncbi:hypothetical protein MANY_14860 [Mycolicibacterium anyangense]|uniref:SHOCT domain-containing protein n=1 Tax=Mycolicibacterium anyangense TaxID=1431246 RepID=A0A6N4W553_9MYCO|nr:SHOCT domain-containing protein [Mycolicibacterium anyangense]BBZ76149.1 hypothetical protein MANY_14860 [Mycolicibacterium anyangense]